MHVDSSPSAERVSEVVALENVTKVYDTRPRVVYALRNVSLVVREGVFLAVMGEGSPGKTTLLKCLSGEIQPSSGVVRRGPGSGDGSRPLVSWVPEPGGAGSVAAAVALGPRLLLADEASEESCVALRQAVLGHGVAAVMSTSAPAVAACADAVVFLRDGGVVDMVAGAGPEVISDCLERSGRSCPDPGRDYVDPGRDCTDPGQDCADLSPGCADPSPS
ncbi:ATP-binding cassette domain-containing protein [Streptomyces sp. NPDC102274]|uniref:ATP-binding cassette domain-containing protein n=1 Tax=Streptomyces sp. NPDC102274 TaxID=3366151 RepID=UPI00381949FB